MKKCFASLSALAMLAACGGGGGAGPQTIAGGTVGAAGLTPGGSGGATGAATPADTHSFVNPSVAKTYSAVSAFQSFDYNTDERECCGQQSELYQGNASTVRNPTATVAYDPRDAIFTLTIKDAAADIDQTARFQDPAHRTDFGGVESPQWGVPRLTADNVLYLESDTGSSGPLDAGTNVRPPDGATGSRYDVTTFFYQKPGATSTSTRYVTFAGYVRNRIEFATTTVGGATVDQNKWDLDRGVFVFGETTARSEIPRSGSGTFSGPFIASMINNPTIDGRLGFVEPSYFQWIRGSSTLGVDFAANSFTLATTGTVDAPFEDRFTNGVSFVPGGATFSASGGGRIDLTATGGFVGTVDNAGFTWTTDGGGSQKVTIAGSSIDGTFYGPGAVEAGGALRIVGGVPDQRVDIIGAFTGRRPN